MGDSDAPVGHHAWPAPGMNGRRDSVLSTYSSRSMLSAMKKQPNTVGHEKLKQALSKNELRTEVKVVALKSYDPDLLRVRAWLRGCCPRSGDIGDQHGGDAEAYLREVVRVPYFRVESAFWYFIFYRLYRLVREYIIDSPTIFLLLSIIFMMLSVGISYGGTFNEDTQKIAYVIGAAAIFFLLTAGIAMVKIVRNHLAKETDLTSPRVTKSRMLGYHQGEPRLLKSLKTYFRVGNADYPYRYETVHSVGLPESGSDVDGDIESQSDRKSHADYIVKVFNMLQQEEFKYFYVSKIIGVDEKFSEDSAGVVTQSIRVVIRVKRRFGKHITQKNPDPLQVTPSQMNQLQAALGQAHRARSVSDSSRPVSPQVQTSEEFGFTRVINDSAPPVFSEDEQMQATAAKHDAYLYVGAENAP
jgi:hypothetical protein